MYTFSCVKERLLKSQFRLVEEEIFTRISMYHPFERKKAGNLPVYIAPFGGNKIYRAVHCFAINFFQLKTRPISVGVF